MQIENEFAPITEEDILNLEQSCGFKFPISYKSFMLRHNGGYPQSNKFVFTDFRGKQSDSLVDFFLPIGDEINDNIRRVYEYFTGEERLPVGMLPIAYDPFGNMICINLTDKLYGSLFFWDHELEFESNNLSLITNDFNEFVSSLE